MLILKLANSLTHRRPVALSFADEKKGIIKDRCLYILQSVLHMQDSPKIAHKQPILMIKIPTYCCNTFVLPLLKLYYHNEVFLLPYLCTNTIFHLNLLLKHLYEV